MSNIKETKIDMSHYIPLPLEADGAPISEVRKMAYVLAMAGASEIVRTEKRGQPLSGSMPCSFLSPGICANLSVPLDFPSFSEIVSLAGEQFNPRRHPSNPLSERRSFIVSYSTTGSGGVCMVAPFTNILGRTTEKKRAASANNGTIQAKARWEAVKNQQAAQA